MESEKKEGHKSEHRKKLVSIVSKRLSIGNIFIGLTILLGIILIINIILTFNLNKDLKKSAELAKEKLMPAKIELAVIKNSRCSDCFDVSAIVSDIKNSNVNVTKEKTLEFDSKEAKEIANKYKIEKIPSVIVTGEIDKLSVQGMEKKENALLLANIKPPYTNAANGRIEGRVTLYNLKDPACEKCADLAPLISQIKAAGIAVSQEKIINPNSSEGKELAKKYNLGFAPTIILSKDAGAYDVINQAWPRLGSRETDGSYVLRAVYPPFTNLTTSKLVGLVSITYLTDKSCTECYDVALHNQILTSPQSFAINLDKGETIDAVDAKGKELIAKYNITQVPTAILSNEVAVYPSSEALKQFFSVEKDGSFVFRIAKVLGTYKDLATNQIVKAQQQSEGQ